MKYVIQHSQDNTGTVIDGDTLHRWIDWVHAADQGDADAQALLLPLSVYVADRLADLIDYEPR